MAKKHWILSVNPVRPEIVVPGSLVSDRKKPLNFFDARRVSGLSDAHPQLSWTDFRDLTEVHTLFNENRFQVNLISLFSKQLKIGAETIRSIEAAKGERCQLVQADAWLNNICSARETQRWLERNIHFLGKKIWMITDTLVLSDTKIRSIVQHKHSVGAEATVPVLSLAGIPMPIPLDPGVEATTARDSRHERAMSVPDKMVFAVQYSRVKVLKRKRRELSKDPDYALHAKATWTPLWEIRGEVEESISDREEDSDEEDHDDYEEYDEQSGSLDEDVFEAVMAGDGEEGEDSSEDDSTSNDESHE